MKKIHLNQVGYRSGDAKKAVLSAGISGAFEIRRASDDAAVFKGNAGEAIHDAASEENVRVADFSAFAEPGEFYAAAGDEISYPFTIADNPYAELCHALLEMFEYQKCGVAIDKGIWSHPPCHTTLATIYGTSVKKDVSGGWHDAGDYGRYVVPAAVAVADLLLAHHFSPAQRILDVTWFEIEWMLKMQCENTGGVYHKVSCAGFNALHEAPHEEKGELILCPITLTSTAAFAATMALATRFYPAKKAVLLSAAQRAWDWCEKNPDAPFFTNPLGISTGGYGDTNAKDEILWAACELFAATGEAKYHDAIRKSEIFTGLGWANVGTYGIAAYLSAERTDPALRNSMKAALRDECDKIMANFIAEPYGTSLGITYRWGSNLDVANNAMSLILYDRLAEKNAAYAAAATEHLHYLLGRNPLSQSYVTGFGANAPKDPHHRPSVAVNSTFPGMVVGGPNPTTERDKTLQRNCANNPPSKFYTDHRDSFASNEIAIYWNSAVYFLATQA